MTDGCINSAMAKSENLIRTSAVQRGITRLCHFTPSRNLGHIAHDPRGILASRHLDNDERAVFNPTDRERLDGHPDHVCCSIQYPNAWYFRRARDKEQLFQDWVVLLINAHYLWDVGAKFCPRNAAAEHGGLVREGVAAFEALFAKTVDGSNTYSRGSCHPAFLPTDQQAEVLVPDRIQRRDVIGIAVRNTSQAKREVARLKILDGTSPSILIVPEFYDPNVLNNLLQTGEVPVECKYEG